MKQKLPASLEVSPGRRVVVSGKATATPFPLSLARVDEALRSGELGLEGAAPGDLTLRELAVVAVLAAQGGVAREEELELTCRNCDARVSARPALAVELGPFLDGELDDEELDAPFDEGPHEIRVPDEPPMRVRLALRRVSEVGAALTRAEDDGERLVGLGVAEVDGERDPAAMARALDARPAAREEVADLLAELLAPPRLDASGLCAECAARWMTPAPRRSVFPWDPPPALPEHVPGFPDEARFDTLVTASFDRWRTAKGARDVELSIVHGPADVDDAGVALLGAYEPPQDGDVVMPPLVTIYGRTFRAMFADEPYDVALEVDVTVRHELDHHLAFLAGEDPVADDEADEIDREARRVVGEKESLRRASRAARSGLGELIGRTWPLWAAVLILAFVAYALTR